MNSRPLMLLRFETSATEEIGSTPHGKLSIFPVIGGSFEGARLRGKVLAGGGDWVTAKADGTFELDLRVTLETEDGALIHLTFRSEEHTSELQSRVDLVCRLLLEKKKQNNLLF